jgi:hypothetical protein
MNERCVGGPDVVQLKKCSYSFEGKKQELADEIEDFLVRRVSL